jgi:NitT/TauT family transport system ATP-binding protein
VVREQTGFAVRGPEDDSPLVGGSSGDLRVQNVSKVFAGARSNVVALRDVNLEVTRGSFVSLLGPSGCGKSTLLRILGGLDTPSQGTVSTGGVSVANGVAFLFQDYAIFPWLSVIDNVAFGLRMQGVKKAERLDRSREWLRKVGLVDFDDAFPEQLSGGMRQRISLARAFVTEPEVLLMDEPMGAVDAQTRLVLQEDLARLWEATRKTVVLVTHSIEEAILLGDRVVVMSSRPGRVKLDINVDLPRPRTQAATTTEPFAALKATLWEALRDDVAKSLEFS